MRPKRNVKPTKIFDNSINGLSSDSGKSTGNSNENRGDEVVLEIGEKANDDDVVENLCRMSSLGDGFDNSNEKECLDGKNQKDAEKSNRKECPNETSNSGVKSYANVVTKDVMYVDNKLNFIPTEVTDEGCEVVIFDEALVDKGSNQWKLTVCGHFVGYKMSVHELRNESGMNKVLELGPWMVNNKPLFLRKWDPTIRMEKIELTKIPLWVSMVNVPLEAWSTEGISALASSLGSQSLWIHDQQERSGEQVGCKLNNMEDDNEELEILKGRMIVDGFIRKNRQPNGIEIKRWTHDMVTYFRKQLEVNKLKEMEDLSMDTEDVLENNTSIAKRVNEAEMEDFNIGMWNIRSMNQLKKQKAVIDFIKNEKISVCGIVETHIKAAKLSKVADIAFGGWDWVSNSIHSCKGCRIIIGWDKIFCCYVYASNSGVERRILWNELRNIKAITSGCPWLLMGDFNVTLNLEEHSAGGSKINGDMQAFRDCVNDIEVEDINSSGLFFTWIKSPLKPETSVLKKLDRVMISTEFIDKYGDAYASFLPFLIFDHSPVNVKKLEADVKMAQVEVEANPSCSISKEKLSQVLNEYNIAIDDEEKLLAQKAKVKWLSEGDKNTKYFHNVIKSRRNSNRVRGVCDENGNWFEGDNVAVQFVNHFEKFLGNKGDVEQIENPSELFTNKISQGKTEDMVREVTNKEIKDVIFDIGNDKAPGPDGFTATFFKKSWDIVGNNVCDAVKEFFKANKLLGEVNATLITLVPKIQNPNKVSDFRPIACCNVVYKCISKIITNRIQGCLADIVSINQSAFVPRRLIQDNMLITQELLKGYNRKNGPQRCALKIDIAKAYDTVNWEFLKQSLVHFGFHGRMIEWIMTCVTSAAFSICVNGERHGYFKNGRGLRHGDPMSPYLFTLVMEVLTLIVQRKVRNNNQFKYHWGCKELKLTQLCFADDLLMLSNGDYKSVEVLKEALMEFSRNSGLIPNMNKNTIFFGSVKEVEKRRILE
ncbi:reverse transcriptase domain, reverse transcriptase zinc-binding domain protein, partial [Tanacetum coccineum]